MTRTKMLATAGAATVAVVLLSGGAWLAVSQSPFAPFQIATMPAGHLSLFANAPVDD